ncbi:MAG: response regulator, partial [Myxococcota bacterium]
MSDRLRVLYVDDDELSRALAYRELSKRGFAVQTAESARRALQLTASNEFDVVVSDLRMPETDGLSLLDTLRRRGNDTAFVLTTGFPEIDAHRRE